LNLASTRAGSTPESTSVLSTPGFSQTSWPIHFASTIECSATLPGSTRSSHARRVVFACELASRRLGPFVGRRHGSDNLHASLRHLGIRHVVCVWRRFPSTKGPRASEVQRLLSGGRGRRKLASHASGTDLLSDESGFAPYRYAGLQDGTVLDVQTAGERTTSANRI